LNTKHVLGYRKGNYIHLQSLFHHLVVWIHYIYIFFDMIKNNKVQGIPGPFYAAVTTSACATTAVLTARVWVGNSCLKLDHILIGGCHYLIKLCRTIYTPSEIYNGLNFFRRWNLFSWGLARSTFQLNPKRLDRWGLYFNAWIDSRHFRVLCNSNWRLIPLNVVHNWYIWKNWIKMYLVLCARIVCFMILCARTI